MLSKYRKLSTSMHTSTTNSKHIRSRALTILIPSVDYPFLSIIALKSSRRSIIATHSRRRSIIAIQSRRRSIIAIQSRRRSIIAIQSRCRNPVTIRARLRNRLPSNLNQKMPITEKFNYVKSRPQKTRINRRNSCSCATTAESNSTVPVFSVYAADISPHVRGFENRWFFFTFRRSSSR